MNRPNRNTPVSDDDMDAMFGYVEPPRTVKDLEERIDVLELKIDRIKRDIFTVGLGILLILFTLWFK